MSLPNRHSKPGPVIDYLLALKASGDETALLAIKDAVAAVRSCLGGPNGAILMELLEKSTTEYFLSPDAEPRALDSLNAQRFIALDLRRIMSDETKRLLE